jgi:hypothetical protein
VAAQLGKPLVLEEFGKGAAQGNITAVRDPWFLLVNEEVQTSLEGGGPLRGSLFWQASRLLERSLRPVHAMAKRAGSSRHPRA